MRLTLYSHEYRLLVMQPFLDGYLPYLLRKADQVLSARFYGVLNQQGVARSEWRVLAVLAELGPLSILDLTAASLSPQPTVTHAVRRLEERKMVVRALSEADRRQRIVSITPAGADLTDRLIAEARRLEAEVLPGFGDRGPLVDELARLIETVETQTETIPEAEAG